MKENYISVNKFYSIFLVILSLTFYSEKSSASDLNINEDCYQFCTPTVVSSALITCTHNSVTHNTAFETGPNGTDNCIDACFITKQKILGGVADSRSNVSSNSISRTMCNSLRVVTGSAGKTFAAFAVIAVGIGFFSGKVSWGLMIGVAAGIAAMFGAPTIVGAISGEDTKMSCGIN